MSMSTPSARGLRSARQRRSDPSQQHARAARLPRPRERECLPSRNGSLSLIASMRALPFKVPCFLKVRPYLETLIRLSLT